MVNKKKTPKPLAEQALEGLAICSQSYREQLDYLLIDLDLGTFTPLIKRLSEAKDAKGMQQLEALLRAVFNKLLVEKNALNKEFLAKDIEMNPEIGVQLQKILGNQGQAVTSTGAKQTKPRF